MKIQNILTLGSVMGLSLLAGQASADVAGYAHNKQVQHVNSARWLDLHTAKGHQINKTCYFKKGAAAVLFSAETAWESGTGWLNTRIWVSGVGYLNNDTSSDNYAIESAKGVKKDWEGHAFHAGFRAPRTGFYKVRVRAEPKNGQGKYWVDDTSLICMN